MQVLVGDLGPGFALRRQNLLTEPVYILNLTQVAYLLIECNCFPRCIISLFYYNNVCNM